MRILRDTAILGGLLALASVPLAASTAADPERAEAAETDALELIEYVEVNVSGLPTSNTIATKLATPLQLTPASVGAVPRQLFLEQDALVLGDALQNVSGMNVQSGGGVHDFFAIRGFDSVSSGMVMTDGVAEPEVTFYSLYNVEGVEVFKGPAGFLYGKNPLAGAVNVVRKQPLPSSFTTLSGSFGSFASTEAALDWNFAPGDGSMSFRLNGFREDSDGYRDDKGSQHTGINPAWSWAIGDQTSLNVNYEYVDARFSPDSGLPLYAPGGSLVIPEVDRKTSYQPAVDFSEQIVQRVQINFETRLNDRVKLRNKTYYRDLDWQSRGTLISGAANVTGEFQAILDHAVLDDRQQFVGNQLELELSADTGGVRHRILTGIETSYESDEFSFDVEPLADVEVLDPRTEAAFDLGTSQPVFSLGDVRNVVVAPYAIDQMSFSDAYHVMLGLRYDDIDGQGRIQTLAPAGFGSLRTFSRDDSKVSSMVGFVYAPDPSFSLYVNGGQSYSPPSTRLVNESAPNDRSPERGRQVELGSKKQFLDGRFRTTVSLYQSERDDIAITDQFGFTQQSGDQRSRGLELEFAAEPRHGLRAFLSYALNDAELVRFVRCEPDSQTSCVDVDYSGNTPIMAPRNLANLWVSQSFDGGFGVAAGLRFIDGQFVDESNSFETDSALVVNASVFYDVKNWRFRLNLKNLTDEEYELRSVAGGGSVIPADPFAAYATIQLRM